MLPSWAATYFLFTVNMGVYGFDYDACGFDNGTYIVGRFMQSGIVLRSCTYNLSSLFYLSSMITGTFFSLQLAT